MPQGRTFQPTGWGAKSRCHVFKPVVPRSDHGMHVNLHRSLSERYQRPDTGGDPLRYRPTLNIIYRQRQPQRVFSAQAPKRSYPVERNNRRLSCFDPIRGPPGSAVNPEGAAPFFPYVVCTKPMYSAEEVDRIVNRLYERKKEEGRCPPKVQWHQSRKSYPAEMLEEVLDMYCSSEKLCTDQPYRNATRHRAQVIQDIVASSKKYTESDIKSIVQRLSEYNPMTWPPNSKGVIPPEVGSSIKVKYPSQRAPSRAYIEDLVERLYAGKINPDAWAHSPKNQNNNKHPMRAKTAPTKKPKSDETNKHDNKTGSANPTQETVVATDSGTPNQHDLEIKQHTDTAPVEQHTHTDKNQPIPNIENSADEEIREDEEIDPALAKMNNATDEEPQEEIPEE